MFSKVTSFFDRYKYKKAKKSECFGKNISFENSMEWKPEENTQSIDALSWSERNALEKSKSDSSITAIGDCNYRNQGTQISFDICNETKNITSTLENLEVDDYTTDDNIHENSPVEINKHYPLDVLDYGGVFRYVLKTQDISTKQLVLHGPEILIFQGNRHSPDEIARSWKKDCRMWLWKSVRLAKRRMLTSTMTAVQN